MELTEEIKSARKMLERLPDDKMDFKPHEKSMTLGSLGKHVAELLSWVNATILYPELDFSKTPYEEKPITSSKEALEILDKSASEAIELLQKTPDAAMFENWSLKNGDTTYFTMPKAVVLRTFCMNHFYHHRGQLSVYLRMLNIPVPGSYGPTADEQM
ncbi:MAG: DinB family protein [Chitinophagales bacterium]|nr:DinB family protein [Chitinophagales bacterium]